MKEGETKPAEAADQTDGLQVAAVEDGLNRQVREDGDRLLEVLGLLADKTPLPEWPPETVSTLSKAIDARMTDPREREKAERLRRHLFAGEHPKGLARRSGGSPRQADRLRADLADLTPFGAGLHLVAGGP